MKKITYVLFLPIIFLASCGDDSAESPPLNYTQKVDFDYGMFNYNTIIVGSDAHSGKKYSRIDSGVVYGVGYSTLIPDSVKNEVLSINVKAWIRAGNLTDTPDLIISLNVHDSLLLWKACDAREVIKTAGEWSELNRTIELPKELTALNNVYVNVMAYSLNSKSYFDIDDLEIRIFANPKF